MLLNSINYKIACTKDIRLCLNFLSDSNDIDETE